MRDIDKGDAHALLDGFQLVLHLAAQLQIQRAQRLVEQQRVRIEHHRARDGHALALPAGKLGGHALFIAFQLHQAQHFLHAFLPIRPFGAAHAQAIGNVLFHIHVREQRIVLEHGVHIALIRRQGGYVLAGEQHAAAIRLLQPGDDAQRGGFAAAGRAQQRYEFAVRDG